MSFPVVESFFSQSFVTKGSKAFHWEKVDTCVSYRFLWFMWVFWAGRAAFQMECIHWSFVTCSVSLRRVQARHVPFLPFLPLVGLWILKFARGNKVHSGIHASFSIMSSQGLRLSNHRRSEAFEAHPKTHDFFGGASSVNQIFNMLNLPKCSAKATRKVRIFNMQGCIVSMLSMFYSTRCLPYFG